jgi:hypothetical protein
MPGKLTTCCGGYVGIHGNETGSNGFFDRRCIDYLADKSTAGRTGIGMYKEHDWLFFFFCMLESRFEICAHKVKLYLLCLGGKGYTENDNDEN